jgi:hypothetical protein
VFGIVLLVAVEVMQVAGTQFNEFLQGIVPAEDASSPFFAPGAVLFSLLWRTIAVFGLLYVARGLVDAREREDDVGARRRGWLIAAVAIASILVVYGTFYVPWSRGQLEVAGTWAVIDYVGLLVLAAATIASTAYLTSVTSTGTAAGERPPGAWRVAAIGLWLILLAGLVSSAAYLVGYLVNISQSDAETLFWVERIIGIVAAIGYLSLLLGFWRGLPGVDEVGPDVDDEAETDEVESDVDDEADEVESDVDDVAGAVLPVAIEAPEALAPAVDAPGPTADGSFSPSHETTPLRPPTPPEAPLSGV